MGKAGLELKIAHLLVAGLALRATATATDKGQRHPRVAHLPAGYLFAHGGHDACQFMPRHVRRG